MTTTPDGSSILSDRDGIQPPARAPCGYCVDGCSNGGAPVPIDELHDYDGSTGIAIGIGLIVAALETALLFAWL